jgi:hypothetical protein
LETMETLLPEHGRHQDQWRTCLAFSQEADPVAGMPSGRAEHQ